MLNAIFIISFNNKIFLINLYFILLNILFKVTLISFIIIKKIKEVIYKKSYNNLYYKLFISFNILFKITLKVLL